MSNEFSTPIVHFPNAQGSFKIPRTPNPNAFLGDIYGTAQGSSENQLSCGFFRMTAGDSLTGKYPYNETLIVLEGSFDFVDGAGNKTHAAKGDAYFFPAGSQVTFSTTEEGLAFYTVQRARK